MNFPHQQYLWQAACYCVTQGAYSGDKVDYLVAEAQRQPAMYKDLWCFAKYLEENDECPTFPAQFSAGSQS